MTIFTIQKQSCSYESYKIYNSHFYAYHNILHVKSFWCVIPSQNIFLFHSLEIM